MPLDAAAAPPLDPARARELYLRDRDQLHRGVDAMFFWVLLAEWGFAILLAALTAPFSWSGGERALHLHLKLALLLGAAINALPLWLIRERPGSFATRCAISIAQGLWSGLIIHLSGGRIEAHFHVFGSLAMLAFYRDWRVLIATTGVVAADHFVRGVYFPASIFGTRSVEEWRFLEHSAWVLFEDVFLLIGCARADREISASARDRARLEAANARISEAREAIETEVVERTQELAESREQYRLIAEGTDAIPFAFSLEQRAFTYVGPQAERVFGWAVGDWLQPGFLARLLSEPERARLGQAIAAAPVGERLQLECSAGSAPGKPIVLRLIMNVREDRGGRALMGLMLDITSLRNLEAELRHAQKLESVGRLAAGVAHEINTPVQFVSDSIHFVRNGLRDLEPLLDGYQALESSVRAGGARAEEAAPLARQREQIDLAYLRANLPGALERSLEGLDRVAEIVSSMKRFAHPDQQEMVSADLNRAVESTLTIARGEYKQIAEVELQLGELPPVSCHLGEINQVLLNLIVNAAHAIEEVVRGSGRKGRICVATARDGGCVVISISDTGGGIPAAIQERIFEPFFTTKEVGRGSGQGLAIARAVVLEKHAGTLTFETEAGVGTTFHVRLPIEGKKPAPADPAQPGEAARDDAADGGEPALLMIG